MNTTGWGQAPSYLSSNIITRINVHNHNTRLSNNSVYISGGAKCFQSSFQYSTSKLWNSLPCEIRNVVSNDSFKRVVKRHLQHLMVTKYESVFI